MKGIPTALDKSIITCRLWDNFYEISASLEPF